MAEQRMSGDDSPHHRPSLRYRAEQQRFEQEMALLRIQFEQYERRSRLRRAWLTRDVVAAMVGGTLLLIMLAAQVVAMFVQTEIPTTFTNAFLLVLGYFFGHATAERHISDRSDRSVQDGE